MSITRTISVNSATEGLARVGALPESPSSTVSVPFTRPNDTTAYAAKDVIGDGAVMRFDNVSLIPGSENWIVGASVRMDVAGLPSGMSTLRLHLFKAAPTAIADNAAFNLIAADRANYLGSIVTGDAAALGDTVWAEASSIFHKVALADGLTSLFGVLTTDAGFTPSAQAVVTVTLKTVQI